MPDRKRHRNIHFSLTRLGTVYKQLRPQLLEHDLPAGIPCKAGSATGTAQLTQQAEAANGLGLQTTSVASKGASMLQYSPPTHSPGHTPLPVTTCLLRPLQLLLLSFPLVKTYLTDESQQLTAVSVSNQPCPVALPALAVSQALTI